MCLSRVLLGALLLLTAAGTPAQPLTQCSRPLVVAYSMLPPLFSRDKTGRSQGIEVDLSEELTRRTGCRIQAVYESRARIWAALEAGRIDMATAGVATPQRQRFASFAPYLDGSNALIVRASQPQPATPAQVLDEPGFSLAVTRGFAYGPPWDDWIAGLAARGRLSYVAEEGDAIRLVALGRVSATIARSTALPFYGGRIDAPGLLRAVDIGAPPVEIGVALSRRTLDEGLITALQKAVAQMRADGHLRRIIGRHVPAEVADQIALR